LKDQSPRKISPHKNLKIEPKHSRTPCPLSSPQRTQSQMTLFSGKKPI
jgi:hypothetical protein